VPAVLQSNTGPALGKEGPEAKTLELKGGRKPVTEA